MHLHSDAKAELGTQGISGFDVCFGMQQVGLSAWGPSTFRWKLVKRTRGTFAHGEAELQKPGEVQQATVPLPCWGREHCRIRQVLSPSGPSSGATKGKAKNKTLNDRPCIAPCEQ